MTDPERLRAVVFGSSIVSEWRNPLALSARAILSAMTAAGHDATFFEERDNPWFAGLLRARGMRPIRAFEETHPEIQHRTYDISRGYQRTIEFAQQVGTADAILALPGTPEAVIEEIDRFHSSSVVRAVHLDLGSVEADLRLGAPTQTGVDAPFGPATSWFFASKEDRVGLAIVAYEPELADRAAHALAGLDPLLLDQTPLGLSEWTYVSEAELPNRFACLERAVVLGDWADPLTWARLLAPLSRGCSVWALGPGVESIRIPSIIAISDVGDLDISVRASRHVDQESRSLSEFDASNQSYLLIGAIHRSLNEKRRARLRFL